MASASGATLFSGARTGSSTLFKPQLHPVLRARCLTEVQRSAPVKKQRLSEQVSISFHEEDPGRSLPDALPPFIHYSRQLELCGNTWALAGCFDHPVVQGSAESTKYVHWAETSQYCSDLIPISRPAGGALDLTFWAEAVFVLYLIKCF